ncbi:hypothetical protein CBI00_08000 [Campylobacter lari]|nr:hypothetical protein [Campylobacter lari]EAJ6137064.1 hypothetical protein [Campylobacter lari]
MKVSNGRDNTSKKEMIAKALKVNIKDVIYNKSNNLKLVKNKFTIANKTINKFDIHRLKNYEIIFNKCQIKANISIKKYIEDVEIKSISFIDCVINNIIFIDDFSCDSMYFLNCSIEKISCSKVSIKGDIKFKKCSFTKEFIFDNCKFLNAIYFNNSFFKSYADFHECEFEKTACFYGVTFEKTPNFSACYFKEQKAVNLTNVNIDNLNFESVEKYIEDNYKDKNYKNEIANNDKIQNNQEFHKIKNKYKLRYAKNLKDSFRTIKDILITQNNKLESQEWYKLELYAKEKEIQIEFMEKDKSLWYDKLLLQVYRNTSNHHINFITILNFTIGMVCIYGGLLFILNILFFNYDFSKNIFLFPFSLLPSLFVFIILLILFYPFLNRKSYFILGMCIVAPSSLGEYYVITIFIFFCIYSFVMFILFFIYSKK